MYPPQHHPPAQRYILCYTARRFPFLVPDNEAPGEEQYLPGRGVHGCVAAVVAAVPVDPLQDEIVVWGSSVLRM